MPQIIGILLRYLFVALNLMFYYISISKISKNWFLCFCFFCEIFGDTRFQ
jgi:hypothetical protein